MKLTPHFSYYEFIRSQTAARLGIDNTPNKEALINLVFVAVTMEKIRALFDRPITITSGYRCKELNRAIGSKDTSKHILGLAVDFVVSGISNKEVFAAIRASDIQYATAILEFPESANGWIHLDIHSFADEGIRRNLMAQRINNKTQYTNIT